ncbi:MAG: hypothetical protein IKS92_07070, partial [Victivallales bacterium]|nr:hypothetical protein [Victivallales bacterium]
TNGLDINGVLWLKELLLSLRKKERTLIVTSHAISELESVLSHYAILSEGQVAEFGRVDHLGVQGILLTLKPADQSRAQDCLRQNAVDYESPAPDSILIPGAEERAMHRYLQLLLAQGVTPLQFSVKKHSLVDVFLSYAKEDSADGTNH